MLFLLLNPSFFAPNYISHCGVRSASAAAIFKLIISKNV